MGKVYLNTGTHLKSGEWSLIGVCRTCGEHYIIQTNTKPNYCPVCGKELGELYAIEEDDYKTKHETA